MTKTGSCKLPQEPQIVLCEEANVGNIEQNQSQSVHAQAECVAAPPFRIVSFVTTRFVHLLENGRMHHARASHFDPALATLERFRFHINLETRLGEWEEVRAKLHFGS